MQLNIPFKKVTLVLSVGQLLNLEVCFAYGNHVLIPSGEMVIFILNHMTTVILPLIAQCSAETHRLPLVLGFT